MKNFLPFVLVFFITLYSYNVKAQAKKNVFFEHFTNASCPPCASQNPVFKANVLDHNKGRIHHIAYHTVWPGTDPMNKYNASDVASRVSYYGISGVPDMLMQGNKYEGGSVGITQDMVNNVSSESCPIRIKVKETSDGTNRDVKVTVYTVGNPPTGNLKLRVAVIESEIDYTSAPGTNGEKNFPDVFRKMLPNTNGDTYTPAITGDSVVFDYSYDLDAATWDTSKVYAIAFIQNETTKEVINSGSAVDPEWELTTIDQTFLKGVAGDTKHFSVNLINTGNTAGNFRINLISENPFDWSASFTYNSTNYTDSADIVLPANTSIAVSVDVKVGSTSSIGNYLFGMKSLDDTSIATQALQFNIISSDITDLVVNNQGSWDGGQPSDLEEDYLKGLDYAGNTTHAVASYQLFIKGVEANQLTNVKYIYFNAAWTFPSLTDDNVAVFSDFLDNGGSLFIAGQDIGWETWNTQNPYGTAATKAFYSNYLNAAWADDGSSSNDSLISNASDDVFGSVNNSKLLSIYGLSSMYPDELSIKNIGRAILYYDNAKTKISAVRATSGTYKTVYFGFSPSMIADTVVRKQVVKLINDWFHKKINGIEFEQAMSKLNMKQNFPNPCNDYTIIPVKNVGENSKLQIIDVTGRIVLNKFIYSQATQVQINTSDLNNGMYFYRLINNNKTIDVKQMQIIH
ncbi:MAG: Omp28-related outer membrane protein [Bacteroidetes bacterium]|nr:Omp28-related outer membrane protein [Bacteroidota bacterium]